MKLFYSPNACSLGIHVILEELGKPFQLSLVDFTQRAQYQPEFMALNPKSKVPTLERDDGSILTEYPAIAVYLAKAHPEAGLLAPDTETLVRALELFDYLIATVHMRGFTRINRPGVFTPNAADEPAVIEAGKGFVTRGFDVLEPVLGDKDYILGDYSVVDSAVFFLTLWCRNRCHIPLPKNFDAHLDRMLARPAVQRMMKTEGLG